MVEYEEVSDQVDEDAEEVLTDTGDEKQSTGDWIIETLSYFAGLPVFLAVLVFSREHNFLPDVRWKLILFVVVAFVIVFFLVFVLLHLFRYLVLGTVLVGLLVLTVNAVRGKGYGFRELGKDYKTVIWKVLNGKEEQGGGKIELIKDN